jgi:hypothetical protein
MTHSGILDLAFRLLAPPPSPGGELAIPRGDDLDDYTPSLKALSTGGKSLDVLP